MPYNPVGGYGNPPYNHVGEYGNPLYNHFDITLSGNLWTTTAPATTGLIQPGATSDVLVSVTIPVDAIMGAEDTVILTFTSQGDEEISAAVTLTTLVPWQFYLPLVARLAP